MTPIGKLAIAVADMRGRHRPICHFLTAVRLVVNECEPSPALEVVKEQVEKMLAQCRAFCCEYDNLRSLMGQLERTSGVKEPRFWIGEINKTGEPVHCRQNVTLRRPSRSPLSREKPVGKDGEGDRQRQQDDEGHPVNDGPKDDVGVDRQRKGPCEVGHQPARGKSAPGPDAEKGTAEEGNGEAPQSADSHGNLLT